MLKEYTIIILTVQNLIKDEWQLITNENGRITEARQNEESINFSNEKEVKEWIIGKSYDY